MAKAEAPDWAARVGRKLKAKLVSGEEFTSDVFAFDPVLAVVVFRLSPHHTYQKADYRLVPAQAIVAAEDAGPADAVAPFAGLSAAESDRRLADAEKAELDRQSKRGVGVTPFAQSVFNFVDKTMHCTWSGQVIVVTGKIRISPPYSPGDVSLVSGADPAHYGPQADRVRMIVGRAAATAAADPSAS